MRRLSKLLSCLNRAQVNAFPKRRAPTSELADKMRAFSVVHGEFERSGLDQGELAIRLGKAKEGLSTARFTR